MGVFICPCKICDKVSESYNIEEYDKLRSEYESKDVEVVRLADKSKCDPFECGIYVYESCKPNMSMSYGTNWDLRECLEDFYDEIDEYGTFLITLENSDIDGSISYPIATDMLDEFKEGEKNGIKAYIYKRYGEDYGNLIWSDYKQYMGVLEECIKVRGIVLYK